MARLRHCACHPLPAGGAGRVGAGLHHLLRGLTPVGGLGGNMGALPSDRGRPGDLRKPRHSSSASGVAPGHAARRSGHPPRNDVAKQLHRRRVPGHAPALDVPFNGAQRGFRKHGRAPALSLRHLHARGAKTSSGASLCAGVGSVRLNEALARPQQHFCFPKPRRDLAKRLRRR